MTNDYLKEQVLKNLDIIISAAIDISGIDETFDNDNRNKIMPLDQEFNLTVQNIMNAAIELKKRIK